VKENTIAVLQQGINWTEEANKTGIPIQHHARITGCHHVFSGAWNEILQPGTFFTRTGTSGKDQDKEENEKN